MSDNDTKEYVKMEHFREQDQLEVMKKIQEEGHCPFCIENLSKYHTEPFLKEGKYWYLTHNRWPYDGTKVHLMTISKTHVEKLEDLPEGAGDEMFEMYKWAEKEFDLPGASLFMRFGDMDYTGSTVQHLHTQFISGGHREEGGEKLKVKLAYKSKQ